MHRALLFIALLLTAAAPPAAQVLHVHGTSPPALEGHLLLLDDEGPLGYAQFAGALTEVGFGLAQVADVDVTLEAATLSEVDLLILASNNRRFASAEQQAVVGWVEGGGGLLVFSDSAFGFEEGRASDNDILQHFNMLMHHDNFAGVFTISSFTRSHPITEGLTFKGEGVSHIRVLGPPGEILATCQGGNCTLHPDDGPIQPSDAVLAIAEVGAGRLAVTFDRNTFFNPPGAGTNITEVDNREYAQRVALWLTGHLQEVPTGVTVGQLDRQGTKITRTTRSKGGDGSD